MKIGILSMQRVYNYGSFLQSYALKKMLEGMGHSVKFVDIESVEEKREPVRTTLWEKYLKKIKYIDKYFFKRMEFSKKNAQLNQLFDSWHRDYFNLGKDFSDATGCDAVAIGSDEIFNCDSNSKWGIKGQRFGDIPNVPCVFSYAASCGYTEMKDIAFEDRRIIENALKKMQAISVRDKNTFRFVKEFTGSEPELNLDPVLGFDFKEEVEQGISEGIPDYPFMVVYAYHNRIDSKEEIDMIQKYAKKHGLRTIAIGGSLPWCDEFQVLTPFQVLAYFKNAACIVTDTFHGTVISAKFNKPLGILVRESNANKLEDLIERLCIDEHKIKNISELERILDQPLDYQRCNDVIASEKEHTKKYLKRVLGRE